MSDKFYRWISDYCLSAMSITVKLFANFRDAAGKDQEVVEGATDLASALEELARRFGTKFVKQLYSQKDNRIRETVSVMVNGKMADLRHDLKTPLKDGDVVAIFPPVAGGLDQILSRIN